jgi:hypothetical protein
VANSPAVGGGDHPFRHIVEKWLAKILRHICSCQPQHVLSSSPKWELAMQGRLFRLLTLSSAIAALVAIFAVPSMAQQPADQQPAVGAGAVIGAAAGKAIGAEGVPKGEFQTYQDDKLVVTSPYYLWHGGCYVRYQSGDYQPIPPTDCR